MKEYMRLRKGKRFSNEIISVLSEHSNDFPNQLKSNSGTQIVLRIARCCQTARVWIFSCLETVHKMEAIDYLALEMAATSVAFERLKFKQIQRQGISYDKIS